MSLTLRQIHSPARRLDMRDIIPEKLAVLDRGAIAALPLAVGSTEVPLGELFDIDGTPGDEIVIESDSGKLGNVGAAMTSGRVTFKGMTGDGAGAQLNGGELTLQGDSGHFTGRGMQTGRRVVTGSTGDYLTPPMPGERKGLHGGFVQVLGNAGKRAGECMRRGLLIVNGDTGPYLGCRMIAGTIVVGGQAGA